MSLTAARCFVAIRPPEFWPRPLFMALVDVSDRFVLGDTLQYSRQSYQNRTSVRTPQGRQWLSIPLAGGQHGRPICDIEIHGRLRWIRKHWRALHFNYRTTPFFDFYEPKIAPLFEREWQRLGDLTCATVERLAALLGIDTPVDRASLLGGRPSTVADIRDASNGGAYISAVDTVEADRALLDVDAVLHIASLEYRQNFEGFVADMSTLDLLFNYGAESLSMIRRAVRVEAGAASRN